MDYLKAFGGRANAERLHRFNEVPFIPRMSCGYFVWGRQKVATSRLREGHQGD